METLAEFAAQLARISRMSAAGAWRRPPGWVEHHLDEARKEYREIGAPLGDTDAGFLAWLQPRRQPPTA